MECGWRFRSVFAWLVIGGLVGCSGERTVHSNDAEGGSSGDGAASTGGSSGAGAASTGGSSGDGATASGGSSGGGATSGGGTGGAGSPGGAGGAGASGAAGMSGGTADFGVYVNATTVSDMILYPDVVARRREVPGGTEISVEGTVVGDGGLEGNLRIFVAPNPVPGTHACTLDGVHIITYQLCCLQTYDTRLTPGGPMCTVTLTEVGSGVGTVVAGTFDGWSYDENGGRMALRDGWFRARLEN